MPENFVDESRRDKRDKEKERDIYTYVYLEKREARGATDEATNKVRVSFEMERVKQIERKREKGTLDATGRDPCSTRRNHERCNNHIRNTHTTKRNVAAAIA